MSVELNIINHTRRSLPFNKIQAIGWIDEEIRKHRNAKKYAVELLVIGVRRSYSLNKKYRHKNSATDVLSFPIETQELRRTNLGQHAMGSIALCLEIAEKQARQFDIEIIKEIEKLIRHSVKHLLGIHHKE